MASGRPAYAKRQSSGGLSSGAVCGYAASAGAGYRAGTINPGAWAGSTVVCIASGPSLEQDDIDKAQGQGRCIFVNSSIRRARYRRDTSGAVVWPDAAFAADPDWWWHERWHVPKETACWTSSQEAARALRLHWLPGIDRRINSGAGAILLAEYLGAHKVLLLGYDCQPTGGRKHWHGPHIEPLDRAMNFDLWRRQFASIAKRYNNIINCSRDTALTCFTRMSIDDGLRISG